ncbi:MAG: hypothetical protein HZA02_05505 [Nitrospinae bacterium]|nr:hypothetical protein [Nitrospinota bacterium]
MQPILSAIEDFVSQLPPLLQLLLGAFVTLAIFKAIMTAVNFLEKKDDGKD